MARKILSRQDEAGITLTASGSNVDIDPALGHRFFYEGSAAKTFRMTGAGYVMQQIVVWIKNTSGSSNNNTYETGATNRFRYDGGGKITTPAIDGGTTAYLTAVYHHVDQRWDIVAYIGGY